MKSTHQIAALIWKEVMIERRTRQSIGAMLVFAIATVITFNFALYDELAAAKNVSMGLLWTIIWLSGTLGINRSFSADIDDRAIDALLIAPIKRSTLFFGKLSGLLITLLTVTLVLVGMFTILFNKPFYKPGILLFLLLGTIGYVAAGVFVGTIASQTRTSYLLTPILILPITLPLILAAAFGSAQFLLTQPDVHTIGIMISLVSLYDLLMCGMGWLFYNQVIEA